MAKYKLFYELPHQRLLGFTGVDGFWHRILSIPDTFWQVPDEHARAISERLEKLTLLATSTGVGARVVEGPEADEHMKVLLDHDNGVFRAKMIQLKWSDETVWKDWQELIPDVPTDWQLAKCKESWTADRAKYDLQYDAEFRAT